MSMAATTSKSGEVSSTGGATMSEKMRATNPYLRREEQEETNMQQQVVESEMATEATWLDGNKNEVPDTPGQFRELENIYAVVLHLPVH